MLLAIDISTHWANVGLFTGTTMITCQEWEIGQQHSSQIFDGITRTLAAGQVSQVDITAIAVAIGPGSFNGLRVAVTVAKTLAYVWNVPLVGISTLDGYAQLQVPVATAADSIMAVAEAGRDELYLGWYDLCTGMVMSTGDVAIVAVTALAPVAVPTVVTGDITTEHQRQLQVQLGPLARFATPLLAPERVRGLGELAHYHVTAGTLSEVMSLQPLYVRQPNITSSLRHPVPGGSSLEAMR